MDDKNQKDIEWLRNIVSTKKGKEHRFNKKTYLKYLRYFAKKALRKVAKKICDFRNKFHIITKKSYEKPHSPFFYNFSLFTCFFASPSCYCVPSSPAELSRIYNFSPFYFMFKICLIPPELSTYFKTFVPEQLGLSSNRQCQSKIHGEIYLAEDRKT